jgi:hypothetical protein
VWPGTSENLVKKTTWYDDGIIIINAVITITIWGSHGEPGAGARVSTPSCCDGADSMVVMMASFRTTELTLRLYKAGQGAVSNERRESTHMPRTMERLGAAAE